MLKMVFGALVASIVVGLAGIAVAGSPSDFAKVRKQKPAKLSLARVHARLTVAPRDVSPIENIPCPRRHRVVSGTVSPGAMIVAVDAPTPGFEGWSAAVGNPTDRRGTWLIDVICAKPGNRWLKVNRGRSFVASKRQMEQLRRAAKAKLR
jgi:hypothetical protein